MIFSEEDARIDGQHELTKVKDAQVDHQKFLEIHMTIDEALSFPICSTSTKFDGECIAR